MNDFIPIIIPAYEPDERLLVLLEQLCDTYTVVVVDDGSGAAYQPIFDKVRNMLAQTKGTVLMHEQNRGKGRALKTAFAYVLAQYPNAIGAVTADSDGQHTPASIQAVMQELYAYPNDLILGVRSFDGDNIPWKSAFGNKLTMRLMGYAAGIHVSDTQTGLRGIPRTFLQTLLQVRGERFEFETQMLLECAETVHIREVPIETVYDSKEQHQTHFDPLRDSVRIYKLLGAKFFKYMLASLSSCALDLLLFAGFCHILRSRYIGYIAAATAAARVLSALYNYAVNYKIVFHSTEHVGTAAFKYFALAAVQMLCSALLVTGGVKLLPMLPEVAIKMIADTALFFVSYFIQQKFVFSKKP